MGNTTIKVESLSKQYRLGTIGTGTLSHDLNRLWARLRGKEDPTSIIGELNDRSKKGVSDYVWSLKDINFEVNQGEVLGIIGKNGAGKSTLLKILSKVTMPTTGRIKIKGRIASLLEVGTGFHPELTGRENIYLNGAILGMRKVEIKSKFDEIVDFAGVERYIDTPVKRYSSGMYVRLAFAVAAFLEPEILIVDEVLAVGDVEFQRKCLGRMKDVSTIYGRTVLFVSHNLNSLASLCDNGLLIKNGELIYNSDIKDVISVYENTYEKNTVDIPEWKNGVDKEENEDAFLERITVSDDQGNLKTTFLTSEIIKIAFFISFRKSINHVKIGYELVKDHTVVFRSEQVDNEQKSYFSKNEKVKLLCEIPKNLLNEGAYSIVPLFSIHCVKSLTKVTSAVIKFNVKMDTSLSDYHAILNESNHPGVIYPILKWRI